MPKLMVIAGEASGDLHGGNVIQRLKKLMPDLELFGTGGKLLEDAGTKLYYRVEDLAVIGIWEVLKRYSYYKGIFDHMVSLLDSEKPDAVFLVDYPGFNLKFAKEAKKRGIKVYYYVAPQVWAWKKNRIKVMKEVIDELILLFPFEVDFFAKEGMTNAHCFGHPLLEIAKTETSREDLFQALGLNHNQKTISIMPGSRRNEITKHLPLLVECINNLHAERPDLQFIYPIAPTIEHSEIEPYFESCTASVMYVKGKTYDVVGASDFALVASGTSTLETAILQTPLLIYYKVSRVTYWIGRNILHIGLIGLPNIVAGKQIVPELVQKDFNSDELSKMTLEYLEDEQKYSQIKADLSELKHSLGEEGAYGRTAAFMQIQLEH